MVVLPWSGVKLLFLGVFFLEIGSVRGVIDCAQRVREPADGGHMQLTFYRSGCFEMPSFLSCSSSKDLVPSQGSVEILDPDRGYIMLSFPYKFLLTSI